MINEVTILPGVDKNRVKENFDSITLKYNQTISIVGPTGSGKTALVNDLELLANGDTNTKRVILINGSRPDDDMIYIAKNRPSVVITQNTKCFSDLLVSEFLGIHSKSRGRNVDMTEKCLAVANQFTGEKIEKNMHVTTLSGGQTRALLIADALIIGDAPIIILDEIENAGIYKNKVIEYIKESNKMVIFVTHDPSIALRTDVRITMSEGKIVKVIYKSEEESKIQEYLYEFDNIFNDVREKIRRGESLDGYYSQLKELVEGMGK